MFVSSGFAPIFRISEKDAVDIMVKRFDVDKSGDLNVDEAQSVPILSRANFEVADTFGDGRLTKDEFVSYLTDMKMQIAKGTSQSPASLLFGGSSINESTFSEIIEDGKNRQSKMTFINYMNKLTDDYEAAQQLGKGGAKALDKSA
ncbi:hypothetical protein SAMN04515647_2383 [Cohaesibacter sp. ES.047]|uniref:hypothetical protein n=1 Tax=Cohaesibacter sp. ES.047 TaxID=1798205 RepID=UPI000BB81EA5|nr:hypothetical protein [Cohaesibacter sp. ES.047]SNY92137.1 hypothetical protein SAMN04515647_2383 [Cohaesibacter sp. ES.047]